MKLAIHYSGIPDFSERWVHYCDRQAIAYKKVNCYSNTIISEMQDCDVLMWHHNHADPRDVLVAKELLFSLENAGKKVFPNFYTGWYFDDKLAQKYLLESLDIPMVNSFAFFSKSEALKWINTAAIPVVFKLRRGAGSRNVKLVKTKAQAQKLIRKAFGTGFRQYDAVEGIKESLRKYRLQKTSLKEVLKAFAHLVYPIRLEKSIGRERGYVYFQEYIPNNTYDIRVVVIKNRAFAIKRNIRKNDFRASGSGFIEYDKKHFSDELIELSFEINEKIKSQCLAIDFVFDQGAPLVVEISFGFSARGYDDCTGYWDRDLSWNEGSFDPYGWMIDDLISNKQTLIDE